MKFQIIVLLFFSFGSLVYSQSPRNYKLPSDDSFAKTGYDEAPASNSINDILVAGDTIWLGTSRGLSRSTDNGLTWKNFYGSQVFGTESISAIVYDYGTNTIWAATAHSTEVAGSTLPEGSGLRYSSDNGNTWVFVDQPLDDINDTLELYGSNELRALPVTVRIQNITYDLAITGNTIWAATFAGGLRKNSISKLLSDPGNRWERVVLPPDSRSSIQPTDTLNFCLAPVAGKFCGEGNLNYRLFSVISIGDSVVIAGSANGINITYEAKLADTTNNLRWTKFNHQNQIDGISGNFVVALGHNDFNNTIWGATWKAEDLKENTAVSYSSDFGQTWNITLRDEKVHNFGFYSNKVIAPADNGPFRSFDGGGRWLLPGPIVDSKSGLTLSTNVFYSSAFSPSGSSLWLGTTDGLIRNEGVSDQWPSAWKLYYASQKLENTGSTYAYSNPFNPKTEKCRIAYTIPEGTGSVTIRIFSFSMSYIRTVVQNVERGGGVHNVRSGSNGELSVIIDEWDGTDDDGTIVPNGVYFYRIDISGRDPLFGKIMVLR
ncbi:MAG: hypothetical protein HUU54_09270 [Ignavibacteriaceae bacterium]|nr:hypothetical protein [Ignavibacteriaceae bacterium]